LELPEITRLETKIISHKNKELDIDELVEEYYQNPEDYFNGRDLSYNLILVYKGSEFLNRLQRSYVVVSTLPLYYSEGQYPTRNDIELEDAPIIGAEDERVFSYDKPTIICPKCDEELINDPYWLKHHNCDRIS